METATIITRYIREHLSPERRQTVPEPNESLISAGILDSGAVLNLLVFIEEQFSFTIDDGEVTPANFGSIDRITSFVENKRRAQSRNGLKEP